MISGCRTDFCFHQLADRMWDELRQGWAAVLVISEYASYLSASLRPDLPWLLMGKLAGFSLLNIELLWEMHFSPFKGSKLISEFTFHLHSFIWKL